MGTPRSRKQKPRQTALSFTPKPAGTPNSLSASQPTPRKPPAGGRRPRKQPNASILNFFHKLPRVAGSSGDGLFVDGEYDDDDLYSSPAVEERDGMVDEELMGLFEEETAVVAVVGEDADEARGRRGASVMFPTPVKADGKKPVKGPFMVDDEDESGDEGDTPIKPMDTMKREAESPPPPMSRKRKMPFELEEDEDEEEEEKEEEEEEDNVKTQESNARLNKHETNLSWPVLTNGAGSGTLNATAAASIMNDEFIDDEMLDNDDDDDDEGIDTPYGGDWEEREERRYIEMLQEQENPRIQDGNDTPQCPICSGSLEGMKEDVSCTRCRPPE
ncbi:hypothetical protein BGX38DRAFT_1165682 [Terfezia claveryi]|nr:hypothetical protein BGX38DRAFT_1165682 [Terfezia claveryi]